MRCTSLVQDPVWQKSLATLGKKQRYLNHNNLEIIKKRKNRCFKLKATHPFKKNYITVVYLETKFLEPSLLVYSGNGALFIRSSNLYNKNVIKIITRKLRPFLWILSGLGWMHGELRNSDLEIRVQALAGTAQCVVPENIHTPHNGGHFCFRPPTPLEFPFQGVLVIPPSPWNSLDFLGWDPPGNVIASEIKWENIFSC